MLMTYFLVEMKKNLKISKPRLCSDYLHMLDKNQLPKQIRKRFPFVFFGISFVFIKMAVGKLFTIQINLVDKTKCS